MAQSKGFYDDIKKEIECPVCQEQFSDINEPKVLQCQHTFCKSCLEGWLRQHRGGALTCPNCRQRTECPNNNIDCLPSNLTYKNLIDILKTYSTNGDHGETFCERHKEKVRFYCEQCEICICSDCAIFDHRDTNFHDIISLEEGARKQKAKIERKMRELETNSSRLKSYVSVLEKRRVIANRSIEQATKEVHRVVERCINSIRQHESSVTELLNKQKSSCNDDYSKELSKLTEKIERANNVTAQSKNILQRNNLQEMLNIKQVLDEKIVEEALPVLSYPQFRYISDDALSQNFTPGQLYITNTEPSLSVATGNGLTKGTQGKEGTFTVTTNDSKGQVTYSEIDNISVEMKSNLMETEDIPSVVKDLKDGRYSISYTPKFAGNFSVSIKVRDEPIKESPFTLEITKKVAIQQGPLLPTSPRIPVSHQDSAPGGASRETECPICLDTWTNPRALKCKHVFCTECVEIAFKHNGNRCPVCKEARGVIQGNQPEGEMRVQKTYDRLPGYYDCGTIVIHYSFPSGIQGEEHPNPGRRYEGTQRTAYLPDNLEGREVLKLLRKAFKARLVFTVGTSVTTGRSNQVTLNGIHHKTSMSAGPAGFGYPDPGYLRRVKQDLAVKGIC